MGIDKRHEAKGSIRGFAKMTLDFSFKRVFGNEKEKGALIAFLNRMIGELGRVHLFNLAKIATFTPGEIKTYLNDLIMERDYWNTLNYAKEVAIAEGKAKGKAKGKAEGKAEATAEAIRKMLAAGLKIDQVCAIMEMTREEIEGAM